MDNRAQVREFLASRRARITPGQAGLPAYGGNRRVKGLRREEVALLAGVSIDYYIRMERGDLAGASEAGLDGCITVHAFSLEDLADTLACDSVRVCDLAQRLAP